MMHTIDYPRSRLAESRIEKNDKTILAECYAPKDSFAGHQMKVKWDLGTLALLLNPYAILAGVTALPFLVNDGLRYIDSQLEDDLSVRALRYVAKLWRALCVGYFVVTLATLYVQPAGRRGIPAAVVAGFSALWFLRRIRLSLARGKPSSASHGCITFLVCMMVVAAATMLPWSSVFACLVWIAE